MIDKIMRVLGDDYMSEDAIIERVHAAEPAIVRLALTWAVSAGRLERTVRPVQGRYGVRHLAYYRAAHRDEDVNDRWAENRRRWEANHIDE